MYVRTYVDVSCSMDWASCSHSSRVSSSDLSQSILQWMEDGRQQKSSALCAYYRSHIHTQFRLYSKLLLEEISIETWLLLLLLLLLLCGWQNMQMKQHCIRILLSGSSKHFIPRLFLPFRSYFSGTVLIYRKRDIFLPQLNSAQKPKTKSLAEY